MVRVSGRFQSTRTFYIHPMLTVPTSFFLTDVLLKERLSHRFDSFGQSHIFYFACHRRRILVSRLIPHVCLVT